MFDCTKRYQHDWQSTCWGYALDRQVGRSTLFFHAVASAFPFRGYLR